MSMSGDKKYRCQECGELNTLSVDESFQDICISEEDNNELIRIIAKILGTGNSVPIKVMYAVWTALTGVPYPEFEDGEE